jgi:hypothetical protein
MTREQAEAKTAERLIGIMSAARLDEIDGNGRSAHCWCSDSNGSVNIDDIFSAFEANYELTPKNED